ncbi:MAG: hypothetical protein IJY09_03520 [Lachnospiraceae bacterium]|nr:hypothetical protein [Lachnospiraceae bacterium]
MFIRNVKLGRPLEIYINRDGYNYKVISKIEEVAEDHICVTLIASKNRVFMFKSTDVVDIVYREDEKMWKWKSVKGSVMTLDGEKFHCFTTKAEGESYNRRNAYRVYVGEKLVVKYMVHDMDKLKKLKDNEALHSQQIFNYDAGADVLKEDCYRYVDCNAFLKDISELGAGFYMDQELLPGDEIMFEYETEFGTIGGTARVVRKLASRRSSFLYYYGTRLMETTGNLTQYIYSMQRKQLKRAKELKK